MRDGQKLSSGLVRWDRAYQHGPWFLNLDENIWLCQGFPYSPEVLIIKLSIDDLKGPCTSVYIKMLYTGLINIIKHAEYSAKISSVKYLHFSELQIWRAVMTVRILTLKNQVQSMELRFQVHQLQKQTIWHLQRNAKNGGNQTKLSGLLVCRVCLKGMDAYFLFCIELVCNVLGHPHTVCSTCYC